MGWKQETGLAKERNYKAYRCYYANSTISHLSIEKSIKQVPETASCRNAGKGCVHKTQSGQTLPWALCKRELCAPSCPLLKMQQRKLHKNAGDLVLGLISLQI
jgi:hypothetical protein